MKTTPIQLIALFFTLLLASSCSKEQLVESSKNNVKVNHVDKARDQFKVRVRNSLIDANFKVGEEAFIGDLDFKSIACSHYFPHLKYDFGESVISSVEEIHDGSIRMNISGPQAVKFVTFDRFIKTDKGTCFQMKLDNIEEPFVVQMNGQEAPNRTQLKTILLEMANSGDSYKGELDGGRICPPCIVWAVRGIIVLGGLAMTHCQAIIATARSSCATPPCLFNVGFCSGECECPTN